MMYNVPQFIDVEDKIAGPLTWKQIGWLITMVVTIFIIFMTIGGTVAFVISVPVAILMLALAFYRPHGMPFHAYLVNATLYLFQPKVVMWDRPAATVKRAPIAKEARPAPQKPRQTPTFEQIRMVADQSDRRPENQ